MLIGQEHGPLAFRFILQLIHFHTIANYQNKAVVYGILFEAAAETLKTIAHDPKHLGAEIGLTAVLHTGTRR
jgi:hypothetical protein